MSSNPFDNHACTPFADHGKCPFSADLKQLTLCNQYFRQALWTGKHLQVTLMNLPPKTDIGLEIHEDVDQFLYVECGQGLVLMGEEKNCLSFKKYLHHDVCIIVPAKTWHNIVNTGCGPLKLFSIYAPPQHPFGTIHKTKCDATEDEH